MTRSRCTGTAFVYSGRPDPQWQITDKQLETLKEVWEQLPASRIPPPRPPPLGYRGCAVQCTSGELWSAYGGVVAFRHGVGRSQRRLDKERRFERALLETAPANSLPEQFRIPT
jgi:hypothetical protein